MNDTENDLLVRAAASARSRKEKRGTDSEGNDTITITETSRELVAVLVRRYGAWLINTCGPLTDDATPDETYDCAGSLVRAKWRARDLATEFGYEPAFRWEQKSRGHWQLTAKYVNEYTIYADHIS
jgi:hypothetical protein